MCVGALLLSPSLFLHPPAAPIAMAAISISLLLPSTIAVASSSTAAAAPAPSPRVALPPLLLDAAPPAAVPVAVPIATTPSPSALSGVVPPTARRPFLPLRSAVAPGVSAAAATAGRRRILGAPSCRQLHRAWAGGPNVQQVPHAHPCRPALLRDRPNRRSGRLWRSSRFYREPPKITKAAHRRHVLREGGSGTGFWEAGSSVEGNAGERGEPLEPRAFVSLETPRAWGGGDSTRPLSWTVSFYFLDFLD